MEQRENPYRRPQGMSKKEWRQKMNWVRRVHKELDERLDFLIEKDG